MVKSISTTETAKLVRKALKANFPNTKFSVKSKSYSGGSSITSYWTDGPSSGQVDKVIHQFNGATFDGMQDLKEYHDSVLDNEEVVRFGADFVFSQRETSITFKMRVATVVCAYFNLPIPQMNRYNWFDFEPATSVRPMNGNETLLDCFNQVMQVTNADSETAHPGFWGTVNDWIKAVWDSAHYPPLRDGAEYTPEGGVIISADLIIQMAAETEAEQQPVIDPSAIAAFINHDTDLDNAVWELQHGADEPDDETPCVKVSAETLQPIIKADSLRERLARIDADALSPLEALTLIYELKRIAS